MNLRRLGGTQRNRIWSPIGTEQSIPEEIDHREIAVGVPVMGEMELLFPPEPGEPLKPGSFHVVLLVKEDMRVKRRSACDCLNDEKIKRQQEVCACADHKHGNEKEGRVVAFVAGIRPRNEMILAIVCMMEFDVIVEKQTAPRMVGEPAMHQRLAK
jgi:hypothetical protein